MVWRWIPRWPTPATFCRCAFEDRRSSHHRLGISKSLGIRWSGLWNRRAPRSCKNMRKWGEQMLPSRPCAYSCWALPTWKWSSPREAEQGPSFTSQTIASSSDNRCPETSSYRPTLRTSPTCWCGLRSRQPKAPTPSGGSLCAAWRNGYPC